MVKLLRKRSGFQPKIVDQIARKPSLLKTQDDLKLQPATTSKSFFTYAEAETRDEEEILQPIATRTYDVEPQKVNVTQEMNNDAESMIHALRSKLGLKGCCVDDADLDDDVLVEYQGDKEEKPQQHEKIVMQIDGSLSFLTFSRFAVVEESTHLLIKVRVGCLIRCVWCGDTTFPNCLCLQLFSFLLRLSRSLLKTPKSAVELVSPERCFHMYLVKLS